MNKQLRAWLLVLVMALTLAACNQSQADESESTLEVVTATVVVSAESETAPSSRTASSPTPRPTATPAPTATPVPQAIVTVANQRLGDDGILVIDNVFANESGWIAILRDENVLGATAVVPGDNQAILVEIDPLEAVESLTATLYSGGGTVFDSAKASEVVIDGESVSAEFDVNIVATIPRLTVATDQTILYDGAIVIDDIVAPEDSWIVVYNTVDGEIDWDQPLGATWVEAGTESSLVNIRWREALPYLAAALHVDAGRPGRFDDLEADPLVMVAGEPVTALFDVYLPPDVSIINQPISSDNTIFIQRVVSRGPGWVTIWFENEDGTIGNIIGYQALQDGLNEAFLVDVLPGFKDSETLYAQLHVDDGEVGEFEFPSADLSVTYQDQQAYFEFNTVPGNYVIARDQVLSAENTIIIPTVVGDVEMWAAVRPDNNGRPGDPLLGLVNLPAGISSNVEVELDPDAELTDTLFVVLYLDSGKLGEFEPDTFDLALQRRSDIIHVPFALLSAEKGE